MKACKLNLPHPLPLPSHNNVSSLLFDPLSRTLALILSDSSILLFPSFPIFPSPSSSSSSPSSHLTVKSGIPVSSSCFLHLRSRRNPAANPRVLFLVSGPFNGGSGVLLRFWMLRNDREFVKAKVSSNQKDLVCHDNLGLVLDLSHGVSVKLVASVNVCVLHSVSARKIWVLAAKMVGDDEEGEHSDCVRLTKCGVIDCVVPIWSMTVSLAFLVLGEENGVRVFGLRPLVKGGRGAHERMEKRKNQNCSWKCDGLENRGKCLENGFCESKSLTTRATTLDRTEQVLSNGNAEKTRGNSVPAKGRIVRLKQDSNIGGIFFVAFNQPEVQSQRSASPFLSLKAISIHAMSEKNFIVLDSAGDVHLMSMCSTVHGSEIAAKMRRLRHTMKVQMLAILPDISTRIQTLWVSDGFHSVHIMSVSDLEVPLDENDRNESEEKQMQNSAIQAIFASEKIHDLIPISANAIMILGQGSIFAYGIS